MPARPAQVGDLLELAHRRGERRGVELADLAAVAPRRTPRRAPGPRRAARAPARGRRPRPAARGPSGPRRAPRRRAGLRWCSWLSRLPGRRARQAAEPLASVPCDRGAHAAAGRPPRRVRPLPPAGAAPPSLLLPRRRDRPAPRARAPARAAGVRRRAAGGSAPELKVRRAAARPNRLGFAVPGEWRLSVTAYPGIRPGDALETLLHELVHLHVGRRPGAHAWHGRVFKRDPGAGDGRGLRDHRGARRGTSSTAPTPRRSSAGGSRGRAARAAARRLSAQASSPAVSSRAPPS